MHNTDVIEFTQLKTKQDEDGRFYITPDGAAYPSITTVLKILSQDGIQKWRQRIGEEAANKISQQASRRGTNVHLMCEDYINNKSDVYKKRMPNEIDLFKSLKKIIDEKINNVYAQEAPLYSDMLQLAGRVDLIAEWDGKLSIIDFKTSRKLKQKKWIKSYFMQASGYAQMFYELTGIVISNLVILIAVDQEQPQVFVEQTQQYIDNLIDVRNRYKELYGV